MSEEEVNVESLDPSGRNEEMVTTPLIQQEEPPVVKLLRESGTKVQLICNYGTRTLDSAHSFRIEGRQIEKQQMSLRQGLKKSKYFPIDKFDWGGRLKNCVFAKKNVKSWILVCSESDIKNTKDFYEYLTQISKRMCIRFSAPKLISLPNDRTDTYVNRIRQEINSKLQLVVCILPPTCADDLYSAIKRLCSAEFAIPSQCVISRKFGTEESTIQSPKEKFCPIVHKIALQINCMMGGELWAVQLASKTMMVCGIDIYHDPDPGRPTVVGFVASTNATVTRWYSRAKFVEQGDDMVGTIKICLIECLRKYFEINHAYPTHVYMFRDGVGDGQLAFCAEHEVPQYLSAFQSVCSTYEPKFAMVVVQKKTDIRFLQDTPNGPVNPSPGTLIDHTVTFSYWRGWWDYFLVSHKVDVGMVTPTYYVVIHDGGIKPDILKKQTFKMTLNYFDSFGPVRVPAPCLYAQKLAYLVGKHIQMDVKEELCDRLFFL